MAIYRDDSPGAVHSSSSTRGILSAIRLYLTLSIAAARL